jgi:hypothetical protein
VDRLSTGLYTLHQDLANNIGAAVLELLLYSGPTAYL